MDEKANQSSVQNIRKLARPCTSDKKRVNVKYLSVIKYCSTDKLTLKTITNIRNKNHELPIVTVNHETIGKR